MLKKIPKINLQPGDKFAYKEDGKTTVALIAKEDNVYYLVDERTGKVIYWVRDAIDRILPVVAKYGATYIPRSTADEDYINTIGIMGRLFIRSTPKLEEYEIGDVVDADIRLFRKEYQGRRMAKFEVDLILEKKGDK